MDLNRVPFTRFLWYSALLYQWTGKHLAYLCKEQEQNFFLWSQSFLRADTWAVLTDHNSHNPRITSSLTSSKINCLAASAELKKGRLKQDAHGHNYIGHGSLSLPCALIHSKINGKIMIADTTRSMTHGTIGPEVHAICNSPYQVGIRQPTSWNNTHTDPYESAMSIELGQLDYISMDHEKYDCSR